MARVSTADPPTEPAARPAPVVFRLPPLATLGAVVLAVCALPFAGAAPWLSLIFLVPVGIVVWVLRRRTTVDGATLTVRGLRTRRVRWTDITSLRLGSNARVSAVLTDGAELPLPAVHVRDLPALAAASGGRLPDPSGA